MGTVCDTNEEYALVRFDDGRENTIALTKLTRATPDTPSLVSDLSQGSKRSPSDPPSIPRLRLERQKKPATPSEFSHFRIDLPPPSVNSMQWMPAHRMSPPGAKPSWVQRCCVAQGTRKRQASKPSAAEPKPKRDKPGV